MIRFINVTNDMYPYNNDDEFIEFAWYDTVTDRFVDLCGTQTWNSWESFAADLREFGWRNMNLERFKDLFPK